MKTPFTSERMKARRLLRARRIVDEATAERDAALISCYQNSDMSLAWIANVFGFTSHQRVQQILDAHRVPKRK